jgi:hypothetical protein
VFKRLLTRKSMLLVVVWLLLMPAAHGFSFPEDWENIRRSMLTRRREQELQVRRKQGVEHQEEHAHQEDRAGAPGQKETGL